MRLALAVALTTLLGTAAAQRLEPFVPVGVWYDSDGQSAADVLRDLQSIRALGFNHIKTSVNWVTAEPARGRYHFDALDQLLTLADRSELKVIVEPDAREAPPWVERQIEDPRLVLAFFEAVSTRAAQHRSSYALDPWLRPFEIVVEPRPFGGPLSAVQMGWRLDAVRSVAGEKGWFVGELRVPADATGADLRLWAWTAIARGARGFTYGAWRSLVERDGTLPERVRVAGEVAGIVSRNAALFAPLRPRPSRVAIVYNPLWDAVPIAAAAVANGTLMAFYERMFARNLHADVVLPETIAAGALSKYAAVLLPSAEMLPGGARAVLEAYAAAGGRVVEDPLAAVAEKLPLEPDVRVDGGAGLVEARFLESADAIMLIAMNHDDSPRAVTFTFASETPEAIWQNMETGASVSFVQGPAGLTYKHAFAARDALVLVIRKRLR